MDDAAAFSATYAGLRSLTDGDYRISFDVPGHQIKVALEVLTQGGVPSAAKGTWFAIARLNNGVGGIDAVSRPTTAGGLSASHFSASGQKTSPVRSLSQHAYKLLCRGPWGWNFIAEHRNRFFVTDHQEPINTPDYAKEVLKDWIGCKESLSEVDDDPKLASVLDNILNLFEGWKRGYESTDSEGQE